MRLSLLALSLTSLACAASAQISLIKDIRPGRTGSWTGKIAAAGDIVFFSANDGKIGNTLWRTNGAAPGTFHLKTQLKNPKWFMPAGRLLFFSASDATNGQELWVSDGSAAGTKIPKKLMKGLLNSTKAIVASQNGIAYFFADSIVNNRRQTGFWRSDGTTNGTFQLKAGTLGFRRYTFWRSAGFGKHLYFLNRESGSGELWRTDGSIAGTTRVFTFANRAKQIAPLIGWNGRLWCDVIQNAKHELWTSDGTRSGTKLFRLGLATSATPADSGNVMYFGFAPSGSGTRNELWKTDGTLKGTSLVTKKVSFSNTRGVPIGGRKIFFPGFANNSVYPWVTDGTANGTIQLSSTAMAQTTLFEYRLARVGNGSIVAYHGSSAKGRELWVSNGTVQGTKLAFDFYPGFQSGMGTWTFERAGNNYVMILADGKTGFGAGEPHALALNWFGAAFNEMYGVGCTGTNGIPVLRGVGGAPTLGNKNFALELENARPSAIAVLGLSPRPDSIQIGPCTLLIQIATSILEGRQTDAAGKLHIPVSVPNNPALVGINIYWQEIIIDPKGSLVSNFALSNGLRTLVGR